MKAYTAAQFSTQITEDRSWRLKEISDLKSATIRADLRTQKVLLRALVTICYAHWEGYVRFAARTYFEHVSLRKFQYGELDRQFRRNLFLPRLAALSISHTSLARRCELVDEILDSENKRFSRANDDLVNTNSNLNSDVLRDICMICSVNPVHFEDKRTFIDIFLLKRRNAIAHGEGTFLLVDEADELTDGTIELMRIFGDELDNKIQLSLFRTHPAGAAAIV